MKLIIGLGNPGTKYAKTRHNIGFMAVDQLAKTQKLAWKAKRALKSELAMGNEAILLKPQTFMNNSGLAVKAAVKKFNLQPADILIVMDDLDMEAGKLRHRAEGSSGGHRGVQSIIDYLGTSEIKRLKIGIGRSENIEPDKYVLSNFTGEQLKQIKTALTEAAAWINNQFLK